MTGDRPRCGYRRCGRVIPDSSPSDYYCGKHCQDWEAMARTNVDIGDPLKPREDLDPLAQDVRWAPPQTSKASVAEALGWMDARAD